MQASVEVEGSDPLPAMAVGAAVGEGAAVGDGEGAGVAVGEGDGAGVAVGRAVTCATFGVADALGGAEVGVLTGAGCAATTPIKARVSAPAIANGQKGGPPGRGSTCRQRGQKPETGTVT